MIGKRLFYGNYFKVTTTAAYSVLSFSTFFTKSIFTTGAFLPQRFPASSTTTTSHNMATFSSNESPLSASSSSCPKSTLTVAQIPCLDDNYGYLIHDPQSGHTAAVDTPDADVYEEELKSRGWTLTHIFK